MSLTLGEKLREAREERGFTLSEVAEQTRISSLYLESIENDDYRILPGGIFNKGFVKSFAKLVGINEQEALADYAELQSQTSAVEEDEYKRYRPEVLTDDRSAGSMVPTVIIAVIILGIMSAGLLFLVDYMRSPADELVANSNPVANDNTIDPNANAINVPPPAAPTMETLRVEFRALSEPVSLTATVDGKTQNNVISVGAATTFEPKENLKLSYSKSLANAVELKLNDKTIALPSEPLMARRNAIEFEINKDNLAQIWTSGMITSDSPAAVPNSSGVTTPVSTPSTEVIANSATPTPTPVATPAPPRPRPTPASNANSGSNTAKPSPTKTPEPTRRPATPQPRPTGNDIQP